ncbi:class I SAM-dependent methyltransferase [Paenibacillus alkalitolerans]|uniref:class I SAM-dependent methyltransferase n=1 Tax=Paenibacillus alkalitolerans TaxID=2799335 RepID=UPI0018F50384|nr:class I SAM-dependent methyltransferase [Paenibacillus alkalitolerans]
MEPWYERSFQEDYLLVYKHRDASGAAKEVQTMSGWLNLKKGARVLDLCCGAGRHSLVLADLGFSVTGVDLSETLLNEARSNDRLRRVRWLQGDMRRVPDDGPYDAVFNLFTSFGYFEDDEQNMQVLNEVGRLLTHGGRFAIDVLNPSYVEKNLVPHSVRQDGMVRIDERREIKGNEVVKTIRIIQPGQQERIYREQVKLYELRDFRSMLAKSGLILDNVLGDYEGEAYHEATSPRMIMIGTKKAGVSA